MACITKRELKNGKVNYSIQIKIKDRLTGKSKFLCTTWKNEKGLKGKKLDLAVQMYAEEWEKSIKSNRSIRFQKLKISSFGQVANEWLKTIENTKSRNYYKHAKACIDRMDLFFEDIPFLEIGPYEIQQLFIDLNSFEYEKLRAKVKDNKRESLSEIILSYGVRKADKEKIISRPTLYYVRKGEIIDYNSAKIICKNFNINFNEFFDKISIKERYAKETIKKYQRVLSAIYNNAIKIGLTTSNYASSFFTRDLIGGKAPEDTKILDNDELKLLLEALDKNEIWETIPLYLLSLLGLRTCEVCGLKWEDIDFVNRKIYIKRDRVYVPGEGVIEGPTKTKSSNRCVFMIDKLYDKLIQFREKYNEIQKGDKNFASQGYIFCNLNGTPRFPHYLNYLLKKYLAMAGCKLISNHKMRHTWISTLIGNGADISAVSKLAGHANKTTTLKIYTHFVGDDDDLKSEINKLLL